MQALRARWKTICCLKEAASLLWWDRQTHMPPGGAPPRAEQLATLQRLAHQLLVADETRQLLESAEREVEGLSQDDDDYCLVRACRREFRRAACLPAELVAELASTTVMAQEAWVDARRKKRYAVFLPHLVKILGLIKQVAEHRGYQEHPYDALLDEYEPGLKTGTVRRLFAELGPPLVDLVGRIRESGVQLDDSVLNQSFPKERQIELAHEVTAEIGYDFRHGRLDLAEHPFCSSSSSQDVRITNRYDEGRLASSIFGALHEAGHALYELGSPPAFDHTPLRGSNSMGFHESQSRFWENMVGRSRAFWRHFYPRLVSHFPEQLGGYDVEQFYRAVNKVQPHFIRVESDELTYNLHILLRFEIELDLLEGKLDPAQVPEAWNAAMQRYLGITPPDDAAGCLQDIHWSDGLFGYFPTYTLGNLIAAALWERMSQDLGDLEPLIAGGQFSSILGWLRQNLHRHASKYLPEELLLRVTGQGLRVQPFLNYLQRKYGELYRLTFAGAGQRA